MYKIDLHCHTIAVSGKDDKRKRQLSDENYDIFLLNAKKNHVKIIAITNHNFIDFIQFNNLNAKAKNLGIMLLLGIELDFIDDNSNKHAMNIIFGENVNFIKKWYDIEINDNSGVKYIPKHYSKILSDSNIINMKKIITIPTSLKQSNNGINFPSEEAIKLINLLNKEIDMYFYEISNINNPNVFKKQNMPYIAGSESENNVLSIDYSAVSSLPIIIKDFEALKKFYDVTINENMNFSLNFESGRENNEIIENKLSIFESKIKGNIIQTPLIKGVNVLFGSYASGKTTILEQFRDRYNLKFPNNTIGLFQNNKTEDNFKEILLNKDSEIFSKVNFDNMPIIDLNIILDLNQKNNEVLSGNYSIAAIKKIKEYILGQRKKQYKNITNLTSERSGYLNNDDFTSNDIEFQNKINSINNINLNVLEEYLPEIILDNKGIDEEILIKFKLFQDLVIKKINSKRKENFIKYIKFKIYKNIVEKIQNVVKAKTNAGSKVNNIGLYKQYEVKRKIKKELSKCNNLILPNSFKVKIDSIEDKSFYRTQIFKFDDILTKDIIYTSANKNFPLAFDIGLKLEHVRKIINYNKLILKNLINSIKLSDLLSKFKNYLITNNILQIKEIKNQNNILNTKYLLRIENITINDSKEEVNISDGQKKIICLRNYLKVDKDIYLLDEPEASLDNSTIMTSIINEMHDLGKMGKTVIIATHNSNIAVYTKPLNLIYREVNNNEYTTFIGNYYDKNLLRIHLDDDGLTEIEIKDKSEVLLNILEGGKDNFIERGNYYGTN